MNFELMEPTVQEICRTLESCDPRWEEGIHTLEDRKSGVEYWLDRHSIRFVWRGKSKAHVFSDAQGTRIVRSLNIMREKKASLEQRRVIASLAPQKPRPTPYWRLLINRLFGVK